MPPVRVRIGAVGHRELPDPSLARIGTQKILTTIDGRLKETPHYFEVISSLAEGADRVIADTIVSRESAPGGESNRLYALLPLPEEEYIKDFPLEESRSQFRSMLRAALVRDELPLRQRPDAYQQAAEEVVKRSDVLIVLWDGKPERGIGGTAETVEYARQNGHPMFWIHSETGEIQFEDPQHHFEKSLSHVADYYSEDLSGFETHLKNEINDLNQKAETYRFPEGTIANVEDVLLPEFVRADQLALKYQRCHLRSVLFVYWMAPLIAATVAVLAVSRAPGPWFWFEVGEIALVAAIVGIAHHRQWHRKWIDYRFLAERFRAALFLGLAGIEVGRLETPPYLRLSHRPDTWVVTVFNAVWDRHRARPSLPVGDWKATRDFLAEVWIGRQVRFYENASRRNGKMHRRLELSGYIFLGLTFVIAVVHAVGVTERELIMLSLEEWLTVGALLLPAIAATLAGLRVHREYGRNLFKYSEMARHLNMMQHRLLLLSDRSEFVKELAAANHLMLRENQDWRVIFHLQELHGH